MSIVYRGPGRLPYAHPTPTIAAFHCACVSRISSFERIPGTASDRRRRSRGAAPIRVDATKARTRPAAPGRRSVCGHASLRQGAQVGMIAQASVVQDGTPVHTCAFRWSVPPRVVSDCRLSYLFLPRGGGLTDCSTGSGNKSQERRNNPLSYSDSRQATRPEGMDMQLSFFMLILLVTVAACGRRSINGSSRRYTARQGAASGRGADWRRRLRCARPADEVSDGDRRARRPHARQTRDGRAREVSRGGRRAEPTFGPQA